MATHQLLAEIHTSIIEQAQLQFFLSRGAVLPRRGTIEERRGHPAQAQFESLGFKFGAIVDDTFVAVDFPDGWKIAPMRLDTGVDAMARSRRLQTSLRL